MNTRTIEQQYSTSVACAQDATTLDNHAAKLLAALCAYELPAPLGNTGLRLTCSADTNQVQASAHGKAVYSTFGHVWHDDGQSYPRLMGRMQFWLRGRKPEDDAVVYETLFDSPGNLKLGSDKYFSKALTEQDYPSVLRSISLGLINEIHRSLDTVKTEY